MVMVYSSVSPGLGALEVSASTHSASRLKACSLGEATIGVSVGSSGSGSSGSSVGLSGMFGFSTVSRPWVADLDHADGQRVVDYHIVDNGDAAIGGNVADGDGDTAVTRAAAGCDCALRSRDAVVLQGGIRVGRVRVA